MAVGVDRDGRRGGAAEQRRVAADLAAAVAAERGAGLVEHVAHDLVGLDALARKLAEEIAAAPPLVVRGVKHVLDQSEGKSVADGLDYVAAWNSAFLASEDLGEAVAAFAGKRPPVYKGR